MKIYKPNTPIRDRLLNRITVDVTGCWIWQGAIGRGGYGNIGIKGKTFNAHRLAYEAWYGPVPQGLVLDHLCRNRACANPHHLEPITYRENARRGEKFLREKCGKGHPRTEENTWVRGDDRRCRVCDREAHLRRKNSSKSSHDH